MLSYQSHEGHMTYLVQVGGEAAGDVLVGRLYVHLEVTWHHPKPPTQHGSWLSHFPKETIEILICQLITFLGHEDSL